jgi:hypothetical protein
MSEANLATSIHGRDAGYLLLTDVNACPMECVPLTNTFKGGSFRGTLHQEHVSEAFPAAIEPQIVDLRQPSLHGWLTRWCSACQPC